MDPPSNSRKSSPKLDSPSSFRKKSASSQANQPDLPNIPPLDSPLPSPLSENGLHVTTNILHERNSLRLQNEHLWKIIQKQKDVIQSLLKLIPQDQQVNISLPDLATDLPPRITSRSPGPVRSRGNSSVHSQRTTEKPHLASSMKKNGGSSDSLDQPSPHPSEGAKPSSFLTSPLEEPSYSSNGVVIRAKTSTAEQKPKSRNRSSSTPSKPVAGMVSEGNSFVHGSSTVTEDVGKSSPVNAIPANIAQNQESTIPSLSLTEAAPLESLRRIEIRVVAAQTKRNVRGKEIVSFTLAIIDLAKKRSFWCVEKLYSDFLDLDHNLKSQESHGVVARIGKLPERTVFATTSSSSKTEQKRIALESYLQHLQECCPENSHFIQFLRTNVIEQALSHPDLIKTYYKGGYLFKKGKNFGGWKSRYFWISQLGDALCFSDGRDKEIGGSISLCNCYVTRLPVTAGSTADRAAFVLTEYKTPQFTSNPEYPLGNVNIGPEGILDSRYDKRYVLYSENEKERDDWVRCIAGQIALLRPIDVLNKQQLALMESSATTQNMQPMDRFQSHSSFDHGSRHEHSRSRHGSSDPQAGVGFHPDSGPMSAPVMESARTDSLGSIRTNDDVRDLAHPALQVQASSTRPSVAGRSDNNNIMSPTLASTIAAPNGDMSMSSDSLPSLHVHHPHDLSGSRRSTANKQYTNSPLSNGTAISLQAVNNQTTHDISQTASTSSSSVLTNGKSSLPEVRPYRTAALSVSYSRPNKSTVLTSPSTSSAQPQREAPNISIITTPTDGNTGGSKPASPTSTSPTRRPVANYVDDQERIMSQPSPRPLVEETPSLALISRKEAGPSKDKRGRAMFWVKKKTNAEPVKPTKPVFGVTLQEAVNVSRIKEGYDLPAVIYRCIEFLDAKEAHKEEGLYRLSGSTSVIQGLRQRFDLEGDVNLLDTDEYYDIHAVSGLLKLWLRELADPVLSKELRADFFHITDLLDRNDRIAELARLVALLPLPNYTLLRALVGHLIRVVQMSDINKMSVRNISIVFSPTLGIPAGIFTLMMAEYEQVFCWDVKDQDRVRHNGASDGKSQVHNSNDQVTQPNQLSAPVAIPNSSSGPIVSNSEPSDMAYSEQSTQQSDGFGTSWEDPGNAPPAQRKTTVQQEERRRLVGRGMLGPSNEQAPSDKPVTNRNSLQYIENAPEAMKLLEAHLKNIYVEEPSDHDHVQHDLFPTIEENQVLSRGSTEPSPDTSDLK